MSTSAVIRVEDISFAELYKHWDGDVASTLPWLKKFHTKFLSERGYDPEYEFAQLVRSSVLLQEEFHLDPSVATGWGVNEFDSCNVNYVYTLNKDGTISLFTNTKY